MSVVGMISSHHPPSLLSCKDLEDCISQPPCIWVGGSNRRMSNNDMGHVQGEIVKNSCNVIQSLCHREKD